MLQRYHIPGDVTLIRQIGLLAITTLSVQEVSREIISRYKENLQTNKQARIWAYKDVHDNDIVQRVKLVLPYSFIDTICTNIIYNKVPDGLIDIGLLYNNLNGMLEIPILGNIQIHCRFILEPNTEVTKVFIALERTPQGDTVSLVPIIHPIWCIPHMNKLEIALVGNTTRSVRLNMLNQMLEGYGVARELADKQLKLTEIYKAIPNITPSGKHGVRLFKNNSYIDEYMLPVHGINVKTTTRFYLKTDSPLYFKRPITESQLLTLHSYKYDYFLKYNKKRSEYTLVCKKRDTDTPLESSEKLINS